MANHSRILAWEIPWTEEFLVVNCGSVGKESPCNAGDLGSIPGLGRSPGEGNRGLQSTGSQRVRHD